jgi:putative endonuclease
MRHVYLLKSISKNFFYIGSTGDIKRRMEFHEQGKCSTTRRYLPIRLIYYEAYASDYDANIREEKLKHYGSGLQKLKQRLRESVKGGAGCSC